MKNTYFDLVEQSYYFPQEGFDLRDGYLTFYGVSLKYLIDKYDTPFKLMYLPRIADQIKKAKNLFKRAMKANGYAGKYNYCYCTKCSHFHHVIGAALKHDVDLETSSSFDIDLILSLYEKGEIDKSITIVHNGYKTDEYITKIINMQNRGFKNSITVLDSPTELASLERLAGKNRIKIGVRMAIDEEPQSAYYTSRLGIRHTEMMDFFNKRIKGNEKFELVMFHFFVDSGIKDNLYYWGEFQKAVKLFTESGRRFSYQKSPGF